MARGLSRKAGAGQLELIPYPDAVIAQVSTGPESLVPSDEVAAVSIAYRAFELSAALRELNAANRGAGMQVANQNDHHRVRFGERYGNRTDSVVRGTGDSENEAILRARRHFEEAAGKVRMLKSGFEETAVLDLMQRMWQAFEAQYGVGRAYKIDRKRAANEIIKSANKITHSKIPLHK